MIENISQEMRKRIWEKTHDSVVEFSKWTLFSVLAANAAGLAKIADSVNNWHNCVPATIFLGGIAVSYRAIIAMRTSLDNFEKLYSAQWTEGAPTELLKPIGNLSGAAIEEKATVAHHRQLKLTRVGIILFTLGCVTFFLVQQPGLEKLIDSLASFHHV